MNLKYISELTIVRSSQRKRNLILVLLVLFFSGFLVLMTLAMLLNPEYRVYKIKKLLCDDNLIRIKALPAVWIEGYQDRVAQYDAKAKELFGTDYGKYMQKPISIDKDDPDRGRIEVLMIDSDMINLCRIGNKMDDLTGSTLDDSVIYAYAGYELGKQYPIDCIIKDIITENDIKIIGVLPQGAEWLPDNILYSKEYSANLDNVLVCAFDKRLMGDDNYSYVNVINNMFLKFNSNEDKERKLGLLRELEGSCPIASYADTIENEIKHEKEERLELIKSTYMLLIFCMVVGFSAYLSASLADAYSERKDSAIRLIYGTTSMDLFISVLNTNLLRTWMASGFSLFVFYRIQYNGGKDLFFELIMPIFILISNIIAVIVTGITWVVCYKRRPIDVIQEYRL